MTTMHDTRAETAPAALTSASDGERQRKPSLASQLATMTQSGAFLRAIKENRPEVAVCRAILKTKPGKRSLDDIHVLKSLLAGSKLLEFFSNLDAYKIDKLYQSIDITSFEEKGSYVFEQDDPGDSFYMVFHGQVEIRQRDPALTDLSSKNPATIHIAYLETGDSFGERALLYETDRRSASAITAVNDTELLFINRNVFTELLREAQEADASGSTLEVTKRFRSNKDIIRNIFMRTSPQRSEKDLKFAVEYLKSVKFFARFSFEVRKQLCKAMKLISAVTNTVLFEEGQEGRHFYIIFSGSVEVSVRGKNRFNEATENVVSRLSEGEYFGELALSETGGVRRATVTCADFCELLILGRDQYEPLIKKYQNEYHAQYAKMLSKNPYFIGPEWDEYTIQAMCAVMAEKYFPFRSEICKQGSRATELFVITRGECVLIYEGKHPTTGQPQQYELGRFGPNSVLGCAEASAGKFNDIYIRDYSIVATSPVRTLVLSRFDIFHLMSADARESLQRSSVGYIRESIESRAIKTVTWERYRKEFLAEVLKKSGEAGMSRTSLTPTTKLTKSASMPVLKPLVQPGEFVLQPRKHRVSPQEPVRLDSRGNGPPLQEGTAGTSSSSKKQEQPDESSESDALKRRNTVQALHEHPTPDPHERQQLEPMNEESREEKDGGDRVEAAPVPLPVRARRQSMARSKTIAVLETAPSNQTAVLPRLFHEKPLYASSTAALPVAIPGANAPSERRRSVRLRSDAGLKGVGAMTSAAVIWTPVHGVCQPFAVVGFMREVAPAIQPKAQRSTLGSASYAGPTSATDTKPTDSGAVVKAFRILGKFTDLDGAMEVFRHVCLLESTPATRNNYDTSRFAIYKEDEITMVLENYATTSDASVTNVTPHQYRAIDLPQPNGQRYACISVAVETPARRIENVAVHVYQCFPTLQSAVRFAKQMTSVTLSTMTLYVVPLFEWVPLEEIDRFDAKSSDLEQALETISLTAGTKLVSTWKARKEAVKKARLHNLKRGG